ncbi:MAG TPA: DUF2269 domain-containing protein [Dehalococcoidia bacterium]|nr:DUF2269 domain-containing protein [Dehalococcoidia bacterium]
MPLQPGARKLVLTAHVTASVGWLGAVLAYLAPAVAALSSDDARTVDGAWTAMERTGWYVIVPMAVASLVIGIVNALATPWGLFRHYWVLAKLVLTVVATAVLLLHMPSVSDFARQAAAAEAPHIDGLAGEVLHAGGGLAVLLAATVLSIYKPRGRTPFGRDHNGPVGRRSDEVAR